MGNFLLALIIIGFLVAILAMLARGMKSQREGRVGVVETWGRFSRVVPPGRYILWPWETVAHEVPLQVFEYETPPQQISTRGSILTLTMVVQFQIEHAHKTPGASRPGTVQVMGTNPPPLGSPQFASAYAGTANPPVVVQSRIAPNASSLEPASRTRRGAPPTRTPTAGLPLRGANVMIARMLGRTGPLDIEHAAYRAMYTVPNWKEATEHEAIATMQQVFSSVSIAEDIVGSINWQTDLGERVRSRLSQKAERWGVEILDISFKDMRLPDTAMANLTQDARLEREARQRAKEAENYGNIARILGLSPSELLQWRQIEVLRELAKNPQARIMFSTDSGGRNIVPLMGGDQTTPPSTPATGYLGGEPPTPALPAMPPAPTTNSNPLTPPAPSLQNIDQQ